MAKDPESLLVGTLQAAAQNWGVFDWNNKLQQWDASAAQTKEARELSVAARKQLAEDTKQFKKSVKTVETAGANLQTSNTEETANATIKAIDALAKSCRVTIKAYQGKHPNETQVLVQAWTNTTYFRPCTPLILFFVLFFKRKLTI